MLLTQLDEYIRVKDLNYSEVERTVKASRGSISGAIKNNRSIGHKVIENILKKYPINPIWLFTNTGEMEINSDEMLKESGSNYGLSVDDKLIKEAVKFFGLDSKSDLIDLFERINEKRKVPEKNILELKMDRLESLMANLVVDINELKETKKRSR